MNIMPPSTYHLKGLMIAAPKSASGKTTLTLGLLAALKKKGIKVKTAKSGPDYIDAAFHSLITNQPSFNLDSWAMPPSLLDNLFYQTIHQAEFTIIESSMGFFDGIETDPGKRGCGADLALRYHLPVLLVIDISGQAQSAAAVAYGFKHINPQLNIKGVILNKVSSSRHLASTKAAFERINIPIFGALPKNTDIKLPARHLGLIQANELEHHEKIFDQLALFIEQHIDIEKILQFETSLNDYFQEPYIAIPPPGQHIAVAYDIAFSFIYPHILEGWRTSGASIQFFSPLNNESPPKNCDSCWLPGGYPELYAGQIANANQFIKGLKEFSLSKPIHGECGGYIVMGKTLIDSKGIGYPMSGILSHSCSFEQPKMHLGYRRAILNHVQTPTIRYGHEFHYASISDHGCDLSYAQLFDGIGNFLGPEGGRRGQITGTFFHSIAQQ